MSNNINHELDVIYYAIDLLMKNGQWEFLDGVIHDLIIKVWRMDIDILMGYATVTLPGKSKLPSRKVFMEQCIRLHSDPKEPDLWKGLE